jgi:hypothetical protein
MAAPQLLHTAAGGLTTDTLLLGQQDTCSHTAAHDQYMLSALWYEPKAPPSDMLHGTHPRSMSAWQHVMDRNDLAGTPDAACCKAPHLLMNRGLFLVQNFRPVQRNTG